MTTETAKQHGKTEKPREKTGRNLQQHTTGDVDGHKAQQDSFWCVRRNGISCICTVAHRIHVWNIYTYLDPPRVSNFSPQVCFWWLRGSNFRPLELSGTNLPYISTTFPIRRICGFVAFLGRNTVGLLFSFLLGYTSSFLLVRQEKLGCFDKKSRKTPKATSFKWMEMVKEHERTISLM